MAKTLNFNQLKKQYLTITLPDERATVVMVGTPTKAVMDRFIAMQNELTGEAMGNEAINELYDICHKILVRNKMGVPITREMVNEMFDFEDIVVFLRSYTEFMNEVTGGKN